jgi:hypothetical protein
MQCKFRAAEILFNEKPVLMFIALGEPLGGDVQHSITKNGAGV